MGRRFRRNDLAVAMLSCSVVGIAVMFGLTGRAHPFVAQNASGADAGRPLAFEVASIKPNKSGTKRVNIMAQPGGRFTATNVTLMDLVTEAYGIGRPFPRSNILNGPAWMSGDRFDIAAKVEGNPSQDELSLMLRPLLSDRFRLVVHTETRERPIYKLTLVRKDGSLGSGLRTSALVCAAARDAMPAGCEMLSVPGTLKARGAPMVALTRMLTAWVEDHRDVRDETGLTGTFDMDMSWTPDRIPGVPPGASPDVAQALRSIDPNGPSLFTALQEQLGLKLTAQKDQTEVLVIDHVEQPTPD